MDRWRGRVAVVTGASAGIGASICKRLVQEGLQVAGFARRVELVQELSDSLKGQPGTLYAVKCDVSKQEDVENSFEWVKNNLGPVQILVNNAGLFKPGTLIDGNPDDWKTVLDTNLLGLCMCSRQAILQMKEADLEGHIVHINSVFGHEVFGGYEPVSTNIYSPTKHAVTCITEIMRREIVKAKAKVKISSLSPGFVKTDLVKAAGIDLTKLKGAITEAPLLESDDIANSLVHIIGTPQNVHIQDLIIRPFGEIFKD